MPFRAGLALCAMLLAAVSAQAEELILKVHHFLPPTAPAQSRFIQPWCDRIQKASQGRLKCQIYPAMQMGGTPAQLFDQARDGVADVVWTVSGYTPGRFPKIEVFELPFMMTTGDATGRAMWEFVQTYAQDEVKDVKILAVHPHGPGAFHVVKRPIRTLADFRGLKLRAPTRLTNKMLAVFGATPVGMPMTQVAESLSKGTIDGALMPYEVVPAIKVHELAKFHSETDPSQHAVYTTVLLLAMNKARYDGLAPDLRKVIDDNSGIGLSGDTGRILTEADAPGRQLASRNPINTIPAAELENWKRAAQPVIDGWVKDVTAKGADGKALLEQARALIAKYGKP
jgi:TRAP-type C4-dicarboxylate transport system substrate-binding protein